VRILCIVPTLDLNSTLGAAPYLNQLLGCLERKVELVTVESLKHKASIFERAYNRFIAKYEKSYSYAKAIVKKHKSFSPDVVLIIHDFRWLREGNLRLLRKAFDCKIFFYDLEAPLNFPEFSKDKRYGGCAWLKCDLSQVDGAIIPSKSTEYVKDTLKAPKVQTIYFSVDPSWYPTEELQQVYDFCYLGMSTYYRENSIEMMITEPSLKLQDYVFLVSSRNEFDFGRAKTIYGSIDFESYSKIPRQSKVNLSITREPFTQVYASSVSRPFELAAMKCCVVSNKCSGMEEWFKKGKEILVVENSRDAVELYKWLVESPEERMRLGNNAYHRVLRDHTVDKRADEMLKFLK